MKILLSLVLLGLLVLARLWCHQPAFRRALPACLPPTPDPRSGKPVVDRVTKRDTDRAFLNALIAHDAGEESHQLHRNLAKAEREEKLTRRSVFVTLLLFMLCLAGLGYCAILLPHLFGNPSHPVMRVLCYLGLGSLLFQGAFLGCLFWHRVGIRRLHGECRLRILNLARCRSEADAVPSADGDCLRESPGAANHAPALEDRVPRNGCVSL